MIRSTLIQFFRHGKSTMGILREGDRYLLSVANEEMQEREMAIDQRPFNQKMKALRYGSANEADRQGALKELGKLVTDLLGDDAVAPSDSLQQLDLVLAAAELAGLPFEAMTADDGTPLFLKGGGIVLTRRVRGAFAESRAVWPDAPRVLFIWSGAGGEVPVKEHRAALREALEPWWPAADPGRVFVELADAKLADIVELCEKQRFTHVHLLAHGHPVEGDNDDRFGIALDASIEGMDPVNPEHLAKALEPLRSSTAVVTLAACDSANNTDSITTEKSLAHALHLSGLPVVIASQLPLTVAGSNLFVRRFYRKLFAGQDVRAALYDARVELYEKRAEAGHDWASVVGYVQLREGYVSYLEKTRLQSQLASLRNLRDRSAALSDAKDLRKVRDMLERQIEELENLLEQTADFAARDENCGLLGSAEKRLAELLFHVANDPESAAASRAALGRAREWYRSAWRRNPSHHWSAVQYLALEAALTGAIDPKEWKTAYRAAEVDRTRPEEYWAQGSLAELALLAPLVGQETDEPAEGYLQEMMARARQLPQPPGHDPGQSTELQLRRYVEWWRPDNGFFPGVQVDLGAHAERLASQIESSGPLPPGLHRGAG